MDWNTGTILAIVAFIFFFGALTWKRKAKNKKLPPGPRGLPIVGHLLMTSNMPHQDWQRLAQKYGPIMHLRFGFIPVIVVSSPEAVELFLKTNDLVFASRPPNQASQIVNYNQQGLFSSPYGSYWRSVRKMCLLELLSNHKINSFMFMRKEEVDLLVQYIREAASCGGVIDLTSRVSSFSIDVSSRTIFGKKYDSGDHFDKKGFEATIREGMKVGAVFNLADYFPQIKGLDLQGLKKRMKSVAKDFDLLLEKILEDHVQTKDENRIKDFVDVMLGFMGSEETEYRLERDSIKAIVLDMLIAAMDTSATAIDWTLSELTRHPRVRKKLQQELENVVGMKRMVEESDLEKLEYLDMVVKESFRLHPVVPLIMHASREDCTVNGFHIPKSSHIYINTWAIGRDERIWTDADKFYPERFVGSDIDLRGRNFELTPFGSGRRGCPGMQLGLTIVRLVVAQLVHCFDWELPDNILADKLDMSEDFGLTLTRAQHLQVVPTWRLKI